MFPKYLTIENLTKYLKDKDYQNIHIPKKHIESELLDALITIGIIEGRSRYDVYLDVASHA